MRPLNWLAAVFLLLCTASLAQADVLTFEDLGDGEAVTTQYLGVVFSNATAAQAGVSLNEFSFPPHSGSFAVFDDGGPLSLTFMSPVSEFSAYFTYTTQLTIVAFDAANNPVVTMMSAFGNNTADGGEPGSSPNEFILFAVSGISRITISGLPTGTSFVMDDVTFNAGATAVPEPTALALMALGLSAVARRRRK